MFNKPLKTSEFITICGASFPQATGGNKFGKVVIREQSYNNKPGYTWQWEGETDDQCKRNARYAFSDMVIALRTNKGKAGGTRDLKNLVQNLVLYKSGDQGGTASINIGDKLGNDYPKNGEECVSSGVAMPKQTNWTSDVEDKNFSKLFENTLNLKSVQCKSGDSAEIMI